MRFLLTIFTVLIPTLLAALPVNAVQELVLDAQDRILIVAPHPDDETIAAGGLIQEAVSRNIPVRVMYLTNGDSNQLAFLYYKKQFIFGSRRAVAMGELRQKEAIAAMRSLGLAEDQLIFLGYPDYGTLGIFKKSWKSAKPVRGALTRVRAVPYQRSLSHGAPYKGESVLADIKKVLTDFKPTKIILNHPADENSDHQAAFLFTQIALWDLQGELGETELYAYMVHAVDWPRPLGLHPKLRLEPDEHLHMKPEEWMTFELDRDQIEAKRKAFHFYKSQIPYKPKYLFTFVRANELFSLIPHVHLRVQELTAAVWDELDQSQQLMHDNKKIDMAHRSYLRSVVYALEPGRLVTKIKLNQWLRLGFDIDLYIFGYHKDIPFADMPKYRLKMASDHEAVVFDGPKRVRLPDVKVRRQGNDLYVSVPLAALRDPQYVIASAAVRISNSPEEYSTWTIVRLDNEQ
jgi:LmbE family N-acetylglucosaminyl deacetylase